MRSCRHCAHENADHLAFCSQCGRKLAKTEGGSGGLGGFGGLAQVAATRRPITAGDGTAYSRTVMATPGPALLTGRATVAAGRNLSGRLSEMAPAEAPAAPRSRVR